MSTPARRPAPALIGSVMLAGAGLTAGLALGRPDLSAVGAAFATVAFVAVLLAESPVLHITVDVDADRVVEGDHIGVRITVRSEQAVDRLDIGLVLGRGMTVSEGASPFSIRLEAGEPRTIEVQLCAASWGLQRVGSMVLRARDRTGLIVWEGAAEDVHGVRVLPGPAALDHLVRPQRTRVHAGNQVARVRGAGTEFAEIRPYRAGDSVRSVNWRLTARRGEPWVNDHHPERSTDIVIFLDTFEESGLVDGVRAAAAVATAHLDARDRVGLIGFGGSLRWVEPGGGRGQEYRLIDTLITTQAFASEAWRSLAVVPRRCLPPNALVLAVSALDDERTVAALSDLRARGVDLAVLQVVPPVVDAAHMTLAMRMLTLEQDAARARFARLGVPVAHWAPDQPLAGTIEEVIAFRRRLHTRSA